MAGIGKAIRNNILVGLLLLAPIGLTIYLVKFLFEVFSGMFLDFVPDQYWQTKHQLLFRLASLVAVLIFVFLIGLLVRNVVGKRLYAMVDRLLGQLPVVNKIYISVRHILEALLSNRETLFQEVVLIEYPSAGMYTIGFVTGVASPEVAQRVNRRDDQDEVVSIFLPTTPNPTSGWLCILPRSRVTTLSISTGEAMKLIMSGGATFQSGADSSGGLIQKVDAWVGKGSTKS